MKEMTKLIEKNDPRYFTETSNLPYDRHHYKIVCENKSIVVDSWDQVQEYWWNNRNTFLSSIIEVLNKPKKKSKGFS